jgi:hypothetical protein
MSLGTDSGDRRHAVGGDDRRPTWRLPCLVSVTEVFDHNSKFGRARWHGNGKQRNSETAKQQNNKTTKTEFTGQYRSHFTFPISIKLVVITMHLLFDSHTIRTKLGAEPFVGPCAAMNRAPHSASPVT